MTDRGLRVAVASRDGKTVHQHFGRATHFLVFDVTPGRAELVDRRENVPACTGGDGTGTHDLMDDTLALLEDCGAVICVRIGPGAIERAERQGLRPYLSHEPIVEALAKLDAGELTAAADAKLPSRA